MTNGQLDRIAGIIFACLGALIVYGAWDMPRFLERGASVYEAPGLTPGLVGFGLMICGLLLAFRRNGPQSAEKTQWDEIAGSPVNRRRAGIAVALTLLYATALFGHVTYILATALFVFGFIVIFELLPGIVAKRPDKKLLATTLATAVSIALVTGFATKFLFQDVFLIQLP